MYQLGQRLIVVLVAAFIFSAPPALAKNESSPAWTVTQRSGEVRILRSGLQPVVASPNAKLAPGDVISTGTNGRAMLTRGSDYMVVAPGSRVLVPSAEQPNGFTRLIQQLGTTFYKVKHTAIPHFAIEAPMLAAVVKGTSFTVIVDDNRSAVQVTDGIVEVTATDGGMRRMVEHGDTVFVSRMTPKTIVTATPAAIELSSSRKANDTVAIAGTVEQTLNTVVAQTGGLVRVEVPAGPAQPMAISQAVMPVQTGIRSGSQSSSAAAAPVVVASSSPSGPAVAAPLPAAAVLTPVASVTAPANTPAVTAPTAVSVPIATTPAVAVPAVTVPAVTTPTITVPAVTVPAISTPAVVVPAVTVPAVTVPAITTPAVVLPAVTVPALTVPAITTPAVTLPAVAVPALTIPAITTPAVTLPAVAVPALTVPAITTPAVTLPAVTVPALTVPAITTPAVTLPTVTVPPVTLPRVTLPPLGGLFGH